MIQSKDHNYIQSKRKKKKKKRRKKKKEEEFKCEYQKIQKMIKKKKKKFNMRPKNPRKKEGSTSTTKEPINEKGKKQF